MPALVLRGVSRSYPGARPVRALDEVSLTVEQGELVAIVGPSGSGKSTLLNVLGLLDAPTSGRYAVGADDVEGMAGAALARHRSDTFAFIFQAFHLLDRRPVSDSVELGLLYRGTGRRRRAARAAAALERVGLAAHREQQADSLSGGERQRAAVARAVATGAPVLLADEPTGNLDTAAGAQVVADLRRVHATGATVVLVTHDAEVARVADRVVHMRDGRVVRDERRVAHLPPPAAPAPPGRASVLRFVDLLRDAAASLRARPGRNAGLVMAVTVAVALAVASVGLGQSARSQVSGSFDTHENRQVTAAWLPAPRDAGAGHVGPGAGDADGWGRTSEQLAAAVAALAGVEASGVLDDVGRRTVTLTSARPGAAVSVYAVSSSYGDVGELSVEWAGGSGRLRPGGVLVGETLARQIELGPLSGRPSVLLEGRRVTVSGVVRASGRVPDLLGAVVVPIGDVAADPGAGYRRLLVRTSAGAAQQVAGQLGLLIDPAGELTVEVTAPVDPRDLRDRIESEVAATLLASTLVAAAASVVGLGNAMVMSVLERRQELGLRRALGARTRHVTGLVLVESVLLGLVGGVCGLALGLGAVLGVTLAQRWAPVVDPRLAPLAVAAGVVIGALGGSFAAWRASRIGPGSALRS